MMVLLARKQTTWSSLTSTTEASPPPAQTRWTCRRFLQRLQTASLRGAGISSQLVGFRLQTQIWRLLPELKVASVPLLTWLHLCSFAGVSPWGFTLTCISATRPAALTSASSGRRDEPGSRASTTKSRGSHWNCWSTSSGDTCGPLQLLQSGWRFWHSESQWNGVWLTGTSAAIWTTSIECSTVKSSWKLESRLNSFSTGRWGLAHTTEEVSIQVGKRRLVNIWCWCVCRCWKRTFFTPSSRTVSTGRWTAMLGWNSWLGPRCTSRSYKGLTQDNSLLYTMSDETF